MPLRFHEFFVEIIENIVALKIILQNPNLHSPLVQKTTSDVLPRFFCASAFSRVFLGGLLKILSPLQNPNLHSPSPDETRTKYFHFLSFAARFLSVCLCVFTSFLLREIIENSLCM